MSEPLTLNVPMGDGSEVDLMRSLDHIVSYYRTSVIAEPLSFAEVQRAVDWLHAKYGTPEGER
jgi:hypothetical protein